ncbi:hypothetical protein [Anaerotignum propionicum]|uniref:IrrE N-terminal-like domain-containing protein n=1 Tax=Anaerotignum propionicum DSM 1682 TaxID=991789 RepID=A0A0X8VB48_ANAPI|nr:hypothetical protein [Anaerotignum propionicum]AMJ42346.1 hypothetical protein CPRO_28020 [Anaerotignum propionicum DSM 1682]SHF00087.1 hypothetical protein SAMN02745151_02458 [[Clostridium] propionicum DSM 1682] [Anaerotignum propionicum DSM 1682]
MYTIEEINIEIEKFCKSTSYKIPPIKHCLHVNSDDFIAQVRRNNEIENGYELLISNDIYKYKKEYQKAVLWHEFTHMYDSLKFKDESKIVFDAMIKTFSESHATTVELKYLLHISMNQTSRINLNNRVLTWRNGKENLDLITANYINQSIHHFNNFLLTKNPYDFNSGRTQFCYFCGYLMLEDKTKACKLLDGVMCYFPEQYRKNLSELGKAILIYDVNKIVSTYDIFTSQAMLYGMPTKKNQT